MAIKLIKGYSGNHPVRNYAGTLPVAMTSPCPYTQGQVFPGTVQGTLTSGSGWLRLTKTSAASNTAACTAKFIYTGVPTITLTLSSSGSGRAYATPYVYVGAVLVAGDAGALQMRNPPYSTYVNTRAISVPYYRYKIDFDLSQDYGATGDWLQVDWSLS
jgi:hypothetical protein